jgi:hypothetical protein
MVIDLEQVRKRGNGLKYTFQTLRALHKQVLIQGFAISGVLADDVEFPESSHTSFEHTVRMIQVPGVYTVIFAEIVLPEGDKRCLESWNLYDNHKVNIMATGINEPFEVVLLGGKRVRKQVNSEGKVVLVNKK